jgi:cell division protease FtsH
MSMPKTKPQQIKPDVWQAIRWEDRRPGADEAKEELREGRRVLRDPRRLHPGRGSVPKGVLLHGPPGTGKTLLAKAVATSPARSSSPERVVVRRDVRRPGRRAHPPPVPRGAQGRARDHLHRRARRRRRQARSDNNSSASRRSTSSSSRWTASRRRPRRRHGRLEPAREARPRRCCARAASTARCSSRRPTSPAAARSSTSTRASKPLRDVDLDLVARQTSGLTGADLANICNEAAIRCVRRGGHALTQHDFEGAIERVVAGVESNRVLTDHEKRVVAFHEAGHALCGELLPSVTRVHKVTIVPRGNALGFAMYLPEEDRYLKTRTELVDRMAVCLGGRVAEELVFGEVTTGASGDLRQVSEIVRAMVDEYAMGTQAGAQRAWGEMEMRSDAAWRLRDEEQRELAHEAEVLSRELLTTHRAKLDELAGALLERETLERADLDAIMAGVAKVDRRTGPGLRVAAAESPAD